MKNIYIFSRAVPLRGSWLFGWVRIIKTIFWLNMNRIQIVALNFEAMSLSFVIVNITHCCTRYLRSASSVYIIISTSLKYICSHKVIKLAKTNLKSQCTVDQITTGCFEDGCCCWSVTVVANRCYCSANEWLFVFGLLLAVLFGQIRIHYVMYIQNTNRIFCTALMFSFCSNNC